jgi:glycylpeptide N-tetradecanoyltransferase
VTLASRAWLRSDEEVRHWLTPRQGVMESFVVQLDGPVTDFASFYVLPNTVVSHPVHKRLDIAYSFYNVAAVTPAKQLMQDVLVVAKQRGFDVFNALEIMDNGAFLQDLKFGKGDGVLNYYLYNFACPQMPPSSIGLVLL